MEICTVHATMGKLNGSRGSVEDHQPNGFDSGCNDVLRVYDHLSFLENAGTPRQDDTLDSPERASPSVSRIR